MVVGHRSLRIILFSTLIILLTINLVMWTTSQYYVDSRVDAAFLITFNDFYDYKTWEYHGFRDFFDYIESFPAATNTINTLNGYRDILSGYSTTGNWALDFFTTLGKVIASPFLIFVSIIVDIVNSGIWFTHLFIR